MCGLPTARLSDGLPYVPTNPRFARITDQTGFREPDPKESEASVPAKIGAAAPEQEKARGVLTRHMTRHVVTRFYRAPEVALQQAYNQKVDMWSAGKGVRHRLPTAAF